MSVTRLYLASCEAQLAWKSFFRPVILTSKVGQTDLVFVCDEGPLVKTASLCVQRSRFMPPWLTDRQISTQMSTRPAFWAAYIKSSASWGVTPGFKQRVHDTEPNQQETAEHALPTGANMALLLTDRLRELSRKLCSSKTCVIQNTGWPKIGTVFVRLNFIKY